MLLVKHRFTIADYLRMAETGILDEDARVELIDGEIIEMSPIGDRHAGWVGLLNRLFSRLVDDRAIVWVKGPLRLGDHDNPQPDLALLRNRSDFYVSGGAGPEAVLLAVEVSDSSVEYDRLTKAALYARHGVREYWIVNLVMNQLLVHRDPGPNGYRDVRVARAGEIIRLLGLPDVEIAVADVMPGSSR